MRLIALIVGIFMLSAPAPSFAHDEDKAMPHGLIITPSRHSVADTMDKLIAAAEEKGLRIFARIDHAKGAASANLELRPTQLVLFGNPQGGTPLMQSAQTMAIDLPLKAIVYEDADGAVHLAYNDPAHMAHRHSVEDRGPIIAKMTGLLKALAQAATE